MQVWSLGWEDPLEEKMATHSSILAWRTNGQRSLEGFSPQGRRVGCDCSDLACMRQNTHIQIPRTWGYITFHDKRWVEFQIELRLPTTWPWDGAIILDGPGGLSIITGILLHEGERSESKKEVQPQKQGQKDAVTDSENEGATSPSGMQVALRSRKSQGSGFSPRTYRKECGPAKPWISAQGDRCQISNLHKYEIFNLYCFRPLSF